MTPYDPRRTLVSLHVPKTAGTSFVDALTTWFGPEHLHFHYRAKAGTWPELTSGRPGLCVHGHFNRVRGFGGRVSYPDANQFIVFLRNPFDRFVSQWLYLHYQLEQGFVIPDLADGPDFGTWLNRRRAAAEAGEDPFSFLAQLADPADPSNVAATFGPDYVAIGLTERYEQSLALFARQLGRTAPAASWVNRARGEAAPFADWRPAHERAFPLEYAVYGEAVRRFDQALADHGLD
ncbi:sulfotransferase family 2 domain-containing protein [Brevundimonas sp. R86498]|uniref:sulfotransferase family 2 domain-containing protein n=1 Tax=Brevundimonas sp. R86498 TaxID=3093845 RepID=UPI0037C8652D